MKKDIIIFGNTGMLGNYVEKYFKGLDRYRVLGIGRNTFDFSKTTEDEVEDFLRYIVDENVVINCAGIIKPRVKEVGEIKTIQVNSIFPRILFNICKRYGHKMIHITTDCVFSGKDGNYTEDSVHDECDIYGKTKSLGEPEDCTVIRTSIIGEEVGQSRSLVEWAKSQKGKKVNGFMNHFWNGITCLQFAKVCEQIIDKDLYWNGVRHIFSPKQLSKFKLLDIINSIYGLDMKIYPVIAEKGCNRVLSSKFDKIIDIPDLADQIKEMKDFDILNKK